MQYDYPRIEKGYLESKAYREMFILALRDMEIDHLTNEVKIFIFVSFLLFYFLFFHSLFLHSPFSSFSVLKGPTRSTKNGCD